MKLRLPLVALCAASISAPAFAHQYWIEPNEFFFYSKTRAMDDKVTERLAFDFTGSDTYFNPDVNRADDANLKEYTITITAPDGTAVKPAQTMAGKVRLTGEADLTQRGTYLLAVSRTGAPMYYCQLADKSWVEKAKDQLTAAEAKDAHCSGYFQHAKAYSSLHTTTDAWQKPIGQALEVVPLSHPDLVFTGDTLKVKLLAGGKPLAETKIVGIYEGFRAQKHGETPISVTTDKDGVAALTFDRPSRWLITTKQDIPNKETAKAETTTHQASLMIEVNDPWVKEWTVPAPAAAEKK